MAIKNEIFVSSIKNDGIVNLKLNKCFHLNFCLPHLAYKIREKCEQTPFIETVLNAKHHLR
jgi:hypothetical protein